MLRFYRNNYFLLGDTCSIHAILLRPSSWWAWYQILSPLSFLAWIVPSISASFYQGKVSTNRNENIFYSANPPPRRPIINMFTKVSMGAKFSEFMRIEKRSSVCVIYQWTNTNKYGYGIRKMSPNTASISMLWEGGVGRWGYVTYNRKIPLVLYVLRHRNGQHSNC